MKAAQNAEVVVNDARERLAYAYVTGNADAIREAQENFDRAVGSTGGTPSFAVRRVVIDKDPISAATLGFLTLSRLATIIETESPQRYLRADEVEAYETYGRTALRFIVRARSLGEPLRDHLPEAQDDNQDRVMTPAFMLAVARGDASDQDRIAALLQANGLGDHVDS